MQRIANKVRVNAQLIDARNDAHLWAQTYDRDLADVFAIQSEIAETIAEQLQAHLSTNEKAEIAKPPTTDPVAYDLYLRARQLDDLVNDPNAKGKSASGNQPAGGSGSARSEIPARLLPHVRNAPRPLLDGRRTYRTAT